MCKRVNISLLYAVSLLIAAVVVILSVFCVILAKRRHKKMLMEAGFRYSQV